MSTVLIVVHAVGTVGWGVMIPVSVISEGLRGSVPYLVGLSVYALFAAHFSGLVAALANRAVKDLEP